MAGALVAGGIGGAAFGEVFAILYETVKHVVGQINIFKSILKSLESTLDGIAPVVQEIRRLSLDLDRPDKETKWLIEHMKKVEELVLKCSKIKRWSWNYFFKAYLYARKLKKLNKAIEKFCQINLSVQNKMTGLETLNKVNQNTAITLETSAKVDLVLEEATKQKSESKKTKKKKKFGIRTLSWAVSRPRDYIVGLPLKELEKLLFNEEESPLLLTALTTLVKMLCSDEDIKVADVKAKMALIKPTDPTKPRDKLPQKTEKKAAADDSKPEKKAEDKIPKAPVTTAVLKLSQCCLCDGCIREIKRFVKRTNGVQERTLDKEKESVIVKGTMDAKALAESLKEKLKRPVEVVPPKKEKEGGGGGDKKDGGGGGGGKKKGGV